MAAPTDPPYYILISHGQSLVPTFTSLSHPVIEYHYADDPPNSLLPQYPGEHVLVLDYDPARPGTPIVKSISPDLAVSALKVADPPGAAVAGEPATTNNNNNIYIIETIPKCADNCAADDEQPAHAVVTQFKQRNTILRRILDYPNGNRSSPMPSTNGFGQNLSASSSAQT